MKLALSLGLLVFCVLASARNLDEIKASGFLRVAVDGETPGFNFYKGKDLVGFEVELAAAMAKRLGLKIEWVVQPFNTLLVGLTQDRFDLIATSHARTPEREKVVAFANPHYCTGAVVISRRGGPKTEAELSGKEVAVPVGTVYFTYLNKNPNIKKLKTFPAETAALQDLLQGRSDAWVTEKFVALGALKEHKELQEGAELFPQTNSMLVAKGNPALLTAVNSELASLIADGTHDKIARKYFEREIKCK